MHLKHKAAALAAAFALAAAGGARAVPSNPLSLRPPPGTQHARQGLVASPDYCDPFSDWDDDADGSGGSNGGDDSSTNDFLPGLLRRARHGRASLLAPASRAGAATQVIGSNPDEIDHRFLRVVTANFANAGTASRLARLSDKELAAIAKYSSRGASSERADLLKLFATRLDAQALVRVGRAFGREPVTAAVHAYSSNAVRVAFDEDVEGLVATDPGEGGGGTSGPKPYPSPQPPRPTVDMTLEEIYLEYRTAPVGSLSPAGALSETSSFAGLRLSGYYTGGVAVGTVISWLISNYAPDLDNAIGGTIAAMIDNFWEASSQVEEGHFEAAFDELFGFPVTNSSDQSGDWDICSPMLYYYQASGTCGF